MFNPFLLGLRVCDLKYDCTCATSTFATAQFGTFEIGLGAKVVKQRPVGVWVAYDGLPAVDICCYIGCFVCRFDQGCEGVDSGMRPRWVCSATFRRNGERHGRSTESLYKTDDKSPDKGCDALLVSLAERR